MAAKSISPVFTLGKQKLEVKLRSLSFTVNGLMRGTRELVEVYPIFKIDEPELRDVNDNMILAIAIAAVVEYQ